MSAPQTNPAHKVIRFGIFEVNLAAGELRKSGMRIRLQEQPFQVLAYLLERPGEVVSREELRQKLWPADTFVDFDHSLNTAVNKVREALGDSASSPRYLETVARRGYRFLAQTEFVQSAREDAAKEHATNHPDSPPLHPELDVPLPHRSLTRALFGLIQIMYLVFYLVALFRLPEIDRVTDSFLPRWAAAAILVAVVTTAGMGIPLRCYLFTASAFDYRRLGEKFQKLFLAILVLDQLWAVAPFLMAQRIGFGAAFAATAALLYVPFSERTLVRLAYS
ncbi:MAG TPA: winged helix-turn-helix domain-containing protein [Terriglobales bacterium]|nr:winged helix-turn-helix domain-containing protein [Terriglobales bacterium]